MSPEYLILGASSYFGSRVYRKLGAQTALGTYCRNKVGGAVRFDALRDDPALLLDSAPGLKYALIMFAEAEIDACALEYAESRALNVDATINVLRLLMERNIKPIFISTDTVFDGESGMRKESDPAEPILTYGKFKLEVEDFLHSFGSSYVVARVAKLIDRKLEGKSLFGGWLWDLKKGRKIRCAKDQMLSLVDMDDAVEALLRLAEAEHEGVFHIGGPKPWNRAELFDVFLDEMKRQDDQFFGDCEVCSIRDFTGFVEPRPFDTSMVSAKLWEATGFTPRDIRETCREFAKIVYSKYMKP